MSLARRKMAAASKILVDVFRFDVTMAGDIAVAPRRKYGGGGKHGDCGRSVAVMGAGVRR